MENEQATSSISKSTTNGIVPGSFYWYEDYYLKVEEVGEKIVMLSNRWNNDNRWTHYGSFTPDEFKRKLTFIGNNEEEVALYLENAKHLLESGDGLSMITNLQTDEDPGSALMMQKDRVLALEKRAREIAEKSMMIRKQMQIAMKVKRAEMDAVMRAAQSEIQKALDLVAKVQKIIRSLELYAGINEDLVQIKEGVPMGPDEPFVIRQAVIFMDEEVGQWREGGFDYSNVEDFDQWLLNPVNLYRVAPEKKCMVAFRPRRYDKDYQDKRLMDNRAVWNKQTYFLIRNGENLYRIFTENLQLGEKVFLSSSDLEQKKEGNLSENEKDLFTRQALFIQGIIDRGEILNPVPAGVNIFNPDSYQGWLRLIYDAEGVLTDGRLSFKEWKAEINSHISVGSRVVIAEYWLGQSWRTENHEYMNERSKRYYNNSYNCPNTPYLGGLFIVEKGFKTYRNEWPFSFKYSPGGEGWSWAGYYTRKNRIAFGFSPNDMVLNYDMVSFDDVDYYMNDRVHRKHYANMLPVLEKIRVERLAEIEQEKDFVKLVAYQNSVTEEKIWALVTWWKTKNKWKRPIRQDDELAMRMISKKAKK